MLIKILFLFVVWAYIYFIPISAILTITYFVIQVNLSIFYELYISLKIGLISGILYLILIFQLEIKIGIKKFLRNNIVYILIYILMTMIITEVNIQLLYELPMFLIVIFFYIRTYNLKFNNLKQTMSNLTINSYGFLVTTTILFGFKIYLSVQNITTPDLYYLFLTIPVSLLIIYFYIKDLTPIIKDLKKVNQVSKNSQKFKI